MPFLRSLSASCTCLTGMRGAAARASARRGEAPLVYISMKKIIRGMVGGGGVGDDGDVVVVWRRPYAAGLVVGRDIAGGGRGGRWR